MSSTLKVYLNFPLKLFYLSGRRGYVPHNMVMELEGNQNRDRWGDIYANMPMKRMVALYDYDPQELSPNVDAEVSIYYNLLKCFAVTQLYVILIKMKLS